MIDHVVSDHRVVPQDVQQGGHILPGGEKLQIRLDREYQTFNKAP